MNKSILMSIVIGLLTLGSSACGPGSAKTLELQGGTEATNPHQFRSIKGQVDNIANCSLQEASVQGIQTEVVITLDVTNQCTFSGLVMSGFDYSLEIIVDDAPISVMFVTEISEAPIFSVPHGEGELDLGTIIISSSATGPVAYAEAPVVDNPESASSLQFADNEAADDAAGLQDFQVDPSKGPVKASPQIKLDTFDNHESSRTIRNLLRPSRGDDS